MAPASATGSTTDAMLMRDAALEYAQRDVPLFPVWWVNDGRCACPKPDCQHPGKHPVTACAPRGFYDATTDTATIREWWTRYLLANIGTPTSWCAVLDVDPRHGGDDTLAGLERQHGPLPPTPKVLTGGGGRHIYFKPVDGLGSSVGKVGAGLDIRATGGYVILPPSKHVSGKPYTDEVLHPLFETPLAPMPAWLIALAMTPNSPATRSNPGDGTDWGALLAGVPEGQRHAVAARIAGRLLGKGLSVEEVIIILFGWAERCTPAFSRSEVEQIVRDLAAKDAARHGTAPLVVSDPLTWPPAQQVPTGLPTVPAFDVERLLPAALSAWVRDIAERAQCPVDFIGVAAMVEVGAVVGRRVTIRPKHQDDWTVVPNLWGLAIGPPGVMKTPALQEALKPLNRLVAEARKAHAEQMGDREFRAMQATAKREILKKSLKEAMTKGDPTDGIREELRAIEAAEPTERRFIVNDATIEKLGELLNENPNGLLLFRDELAGLLRTMDREGHENDRAFLCEAWNGNGSYVYDRIARGTVHINAACVSILGGIQPGPLHAYLREVFGTGEQDDGLIQRFQLMVYPDITGAWRNVDRWPDSTAKAHVFDVLGRLADLDPGKLGADMPTPEDQHLPFLRFTCEAQAGFDAWRAQLEPRVRGSDDHPVVIGHLAKYRSLMPSLALLLHLIDCVDLGTSGPVSQAAAERAIAWCTYLEAHARRVYESVTAGARMAAAVLSARISAGKLASPFTARTLVRNGWGMLSTSDEADAAIGMLEDLGWLRREDVPTGMRGGRPTSQYHINPGVLPR